MIMYPVDLRRIKSHPAPQTTERSHFTLLLYILPPLHICKPEIAHFHSKEQTLHTFKHFYSQINWTRRLTFNLAKGLQNPAAFKMPPKCQCLASSAAVRISFSFALSQWFPFSEIRLITIQPCLDGHHPNQPLAWRHTCGSEQFRLIHWPHLQD